MTKSYSMKYFLFAGFLLVFIIPFLMLIFSRIPMLDKLKESVYERNKDISKTLKNNINIIINGFKENFNIIKHLLDYKPEDLDSFLSYIVNSVNTLERLMIIDKNGTAVNVYPYNESTLRNDMSNQDFFIKPVQTNEVYVSNTFFSPDTKKTTLTMSESYNGWVIVGYFNLIELIDDIYEITEETNIMISIVDRLGYYIVDPDILNVQQKVKSLEYIRTKDSLSDPDKYLEYMFNYREDLSAFVTISREKNTKWTIFTYQDKNYALKTINDMQRIYIISIVIVVILTTVLIVYVSRRIFKSVNLLLSNTESITQGNYDIKLDARNFLEFKKLIDNFKTMSNALRDREQKLIGSEKRFRNMIEYSPLPIGLANLGGKIEFYNPKFTETYGYTIEDTPTFEEWFKAAYPDEEYRKKIMSEWEREIRKNLIGDKNKISFLAEIQCKDKTKKNVEISTTKYEDKLITVFSDFTEVVKAEKKIRDINKELEEKVNQRTLELQNLYEEIEQTNEELLSTNDYLENTLKVLTETQKQLIESEKMSTIGSLVAGIAHEINTPLGVSITLSSHIENNLVKYKKIFDNDEMTYEDLDEYFDTASKSINMIMFNLKRVSNLVKSFRQISVDQSIQNKRLFNVKKYIDDVLLSLNSTLKKTKHTVIFNCDDDIKINSYPDAFFQIITNLVNNSLMHAFEDMNRGEIKIDIESKEKKLIIIYTDNGIGIKKNDLDKIFEPFYTTKRNKGGTGLGLNIVYNIVNQKLKGKILCHSEYRKGTTFKIILPLGGEVIFND